jgi:glucose-1-phosphate thymidylyltransferase
MRKGIILAGGTGSRLFPITMSTSKQLLPVYDKPLIYYPLTTLMMAGIQEVLIIVKAGDRERFEALLGDGSQWGLKLAFLEQQRPDGIAQALILGEEFLAGSPCALILGDNIFYGDNLTTLVRENSRREQGASVFAYWVNDPERYGVVEFDDQMRPIAIVEKPTIPKSNYAVTGLYFYDAEAPALARSLQPSGRGELEITDLNRLYLERGLLHVERFGRGYAWLDAGTHDSLLEAGTFIQTVEKRQGLKIACPEEIAFRAGWIDLAEIERQAERLGAGEYGQYVRRIAMGLTT